MHTHTYTGYQENTVAVWKKTDKYKLYKLLNCMKAVNLFIPSENKWEGCLLSAVVNIFFRFSAVWFYPLEPSLKFRHAITVRRIMINKYLVIYALARFYVWKNVLEAVFSACFCEWVTSPSCFLCQCQVATRWIWDSYQNHERKGIRTIWDPPCSSSLYRAL